MSKLHDFLTAPMARHPFLLHRKIREKLRGRQPCTFSTLPEVQYSTERLGFILSHLRDWADGAPVTETRIDETMVFGQLFDREFLFQCCKKGPVKDDPALKGDIKLPWEFSRGYSHILNALLCKSDDEKDRCATRISMSIQEWWKYNDNPNGVNWIVAMEVGIRAFNWVCADAVLDGRIAARLGHEKFYGSLWNHGCIIWDRLECSLLKVSNHYTADLLGLTVLGLVFNASSAGKKWLRFASQEMESSIVRHQTNEDGGVKENSLRYHALVAEMCLHFYALLEGNVGKQFRCRLVKMCEVISAYRDSSTGDVFAIGDDDGSRIIPLDFVSAWGRADALLVYATRMLEHSFEPSDSTVHPQSGWAVLRQGAFEVVAEFGPLTGAHAHNDTLSFCVNYDGIPVLVDPGSGIYTPNIVLRNTLRGITHHSVVQFEDSTQGLPGNGALGAFYMDGPKQSSRVEISKNRMELNNAFPAQGINAKHKRTLDLRECNKLLVVDEIKGAFQRAVWRFVLHPSIHAEALDNGFKLKMFDGRAFLLNCDTAMDVSISSGSFSSFYGSHEDNSICVATLRINSESKSTVNWELKVVQESPITT